MNRTASAVIFALFAAAALSVWILSEKHFGNEITDMLPENSEAAGILRTLHEENISSKITIEIKLKKECHDPMVLIHAAELLEASLTHPAIRSITSGIKLPSINMMTHAYNLLPMLADETVMKQVESMTSPEQVKSAMRKNYVRLVSPSGFSSTFTEADPLGLNSLVLSRLTRFAGAFNYKIHPGSSRLIGLDQRRAILLLDTDVPVTDNKRSAELLGFIRNKIAALDFPVTGNIICGHLHSLSNEKTLRGDITAVSIASVLVFIFLFLVVYRGAPRSFYIIMVPGFAVLYSLAVMSLFINTLSGFIIGFGGMISGFAVDYGIFVYAAYGKSGHAGIRRILRPLFGAAATTIGIFIGFFFSGVGGYCQLASFAILSVLFSLLLAIFALPALLGKWRMPDAASHKKPFQFSRRGAFFCLAIWAILLSAAGIMTYKYLNISNDILTLDGSSSEIFANEKDFRDYWNKSNMPAILVQRANSREALLERGEMILKKAYAVAGKDFISPAELLPAAKTRLANQQNWRKYWTAQRLDNLRNALLQYGEANGFTAAAFNDFMQNISSSASAKTDVNTADNLLSAIGKYCVREDKGVWKMYSFFPDTPAACRSIKSLLSEFPECRIISPRSLEKALGDEVFNRLLIVAGAAVIVVFILGIIATGSIFQGMLAMLPTFSALLLVSGCFAVFNLPFSIPVCIACIIVIGLSTDYGIFEVFQYFRKMPDNITPSVTCCAMTTSAGAGTLLFAHHPILFYLGLALTGGMIVAYVAAVTMIPALAALMKTGKTKLLMPLFAILILYAAGCAGIPEPLPLTTLKSSPAPEKFIPPDTGWNTVASLVFTVRGRSIPLLCNAEFDPGMRKIAMVALNPDGNMKVFSVAAGNGVITHQEMTPQLKQLPDLPKDVIRDMGRISFDLLPTAEYRKSYKENVISFTNNGLTLNYDAQSGLLIEKIYTKNEQCLWKIDFREYKLEKGFSVPCQIRLINFNPDYSIMIKVKEFTLIEQKDNMK